MKSKIVTCAFVFLIVTGVTAGTAFAQENEKYPNSEYVFSDSLQLVDYEFNEHNEVILHFSSDFNQNVVITDAFIDPDKAKKGNIQEIRQEEYMVNGDQTIRFPVTEVDRNKGVTISAEGQLIPVVEITPRSPILGSHVYAPTTLLAQGVIGFGCGISLVMILAYYKRMEYSGEVEKEL